MNAESSETIDGAEQAGAVQEEANTSRSGRVIRRAVPKASSLIPSKYVGEMQPSTANNLDEKSAIDAADAGQIPAQEHRNPFNSFEFKIACHTICLHALRRWESGRGKGGRNDQCNRE